MPTSVGTSQFAYVNNSGDMIGADGGGDFATEAAAIAAAQADPNGKIAIDVVTPASTSSTPRSTRQATRLRSCTSPSTPIRSV